MPAHADLRPVVWEEMRRLEALGLGTAERRSEHRERFLLQPGHPRAPVLSTRPEAKGFVRADEGSLLFRDASSQLRDIVPHDLATRAMPPKKGLEFRWTQIGPSDIRLLFELIIWLSSTDVLDL
jgi:hypothetical protein